MRLSGTLLLFLSLPAGLAAQQKDARAIVERGITAVGGFDKLTKSPALTWKGKGIYYGLPGAASLPFTVEGARDGASRSAIKVIGKTLDGLMERKLVIEGGKGWLKLNERVSELGKDALEEEQARLRAAWIATLAPLRGKQFALTLIAPARVAGRETVGVKVEEKGQREVLLFFDKERGELRKQASEISDPLAGGRVIAQEIHFDDYRPDADGVRRARRVKVYWDGRLISQAELTSLTPHAKLPDKTFQRP